MPANLPTALHATLVHLKLAREALEDAQKSPHAAAAKLDFARELAIICELHHALRAVYMGLTIACAP